MVQTSRNIVPDVSQNFGNLSGLGTRVIKADNATLRQQQFLPQVDLEGDQALLGQEQARSITCWN